MASPFTNALTTHWIEDGTADRMLSAVRDECANRQAMVNRLLADYNVQGHPQAFHFWLHLHSKWEAMDFANHLRSQGVAVVASAAFSTDADPPNAVRICLGGPTSLIECERGMQLVAEALKYPMTHHALTL